MTEIDSEKSQSKNGIQVIARAASILRTLRDSPKGMSLGQIADQVALARSTVQRIIAALQDERLVVSTGNGGLRLGPEITSLATGAHFSVVDLCRPHLTELVRSTGETVDLSCLRGTGMIFLDQVAGTHRLRTVSFVGDIFPLTDTANGRAVLALMPRDQAKKMTISEWTARGIDGDWDTYSRMLDRVSATGIAYDEDEHSMGVSAMGIAFADWSGDLHAISVPMPSSRYERLKPIVEHHLSALKRTISDTVIGSKT